MRTALPCQRLAENAEKRRVAIDFRAFWASLRSCQLSTDVNCSCGKDMKRWRWKDVTYVKAIESLTHCMSTHHFPSLPKSSRVTKCSCLQGQPEVVGQFKECIAFFVQIARHERFLFRLLLYFSCLALFPRQDRPDPFNLVFLSCPSLLVLTWKRFIPQDIERVFQQRSDVLCHLVKGPLWRSGLVDGVSDRVLVRKSKRFRRFAPSLGVQGRIRLVKTDLKVNWAGGVMVNHAGIGWIGHHHEMIWKISRWYRQQRPNFRQKNMVFVFRSWLSLGLQFCQRYQQVEHTNQLQQMRRIP